MVNIKHLKPVVREQMVKSSGFCNKLLYSSIWGLAKFPHMLLRQSLATVRRPTLNEMSSGHKVIPSFVRTRSMYLFFFFVRITLKRVPRCFHFYFHESVHILRKQSTVTCAWIILCYCIILPHLIHLQQSISNLHCLLQFNRYPSA